MGKDYLKKVPTLYEMYAKDIEEDEKNYSLNGFPVNVGGFLSIRARQFKTFALFTYLLNKDVALMKNRFYCAALCGYKSMEAYDNENSNELPLGVLSMIRMDGLEYAIISENMDLVLRYANKLGGRGKLDSDGVNKVYYHHGYILKYVVEDKYDQAQEHIDRALDKKKSDYVDWYIEAIKGIIDHDQDQVNNSLAEMLNEHRKSRTIRNTPDEFISIVVLATAKLALMKGIEITLDDPLAPREIIMPTENISYEVVNFLK